jgi:hypothetical protein
VDPKDGSESFGVQKGSGEPGDTSDRSPYWPQRLAKGAETLAPGSKFEAVLEGNDLAHTSINNGKAIAKGLAFRPLVDTVKDTLAWWGTVPEERRAKPRFIITPEIEAKALADWKRK